ncbi:NAD(P)-binding protein [Gyrodon lividus]|nr:NAD(P)-binding protein [Gyrodon lividus]
MPSTPKVWLVTSSSSDFGRSMVELLLKKGDKVVATLRKPDDLADLAAKYPTSQLVPVKLDVTQSSEIAAAFKMARLAFGRIDVVFNNANQRMIGNVESVSEKDARRLFDAAVRFFRDVNSPPGGRLLQVSSHGGIVGVPATGFHSASKFALEGLSECLAAELDPAWNIKVTIIEPGSFYTKIIEGNMKMTTQLPAYANSTSASSQLRSFFVTGADGDADKATATMEKLVHLDNPPLRLPLHKMTVAAVKYKHTSRGRRICVLIDVHACPCIMQIVSV